MTAIDYNFADANELRRSLHARFDDLARRVRARLLLEAAARWLALIALLAALCFALDRMLRLSHLTRRGLLAAFIAIAILEAWRRFVLPLRLQLDPHVLAAALERKIGRPVAARVATVLQMRGGEDAISSAMIDRAVARSYESLGALDLEQHLDQRRQKLSILALFATAITWLAIAVIFPVSTKLWAARFFAGSDQPWPQRTYLQIAGVKDGLMLVPRGEGFALRVWAAAESVVPESISIRWRQGKSPRVSAPLVRFAANDFRYDFPAVESDVQLELSGGDDVLGPIVIRPVDRPRIVDLVLITQHPTEAQPATHHFSGEESGDLSFLPLTSMQLRFRANTAVAEARVRSATTHPSLADVRRIDDTQFAIDWTHDARTQLQIELVGREAGLTSVPTNVQIDLKKDRPPRASIAFSGVRQRITPQAIIPLVLEARDDFGVSRLDLALKTESPDPADPKRMRSGAATRPIYPTTQPATASASAPARETDVRQPTELEVAPLRLDPGGLLSLTAVASDDCYTGAQIASSRQITFRIVRPEELFRDILLRQQSERAKFRKQIDEARRIREALPSSDAAQLARQHRALAREVNRIRAALADSLTEMRLNQLGTPEAYALMEKSVLSPLKALDEELLSPQADALDRLRGDDAAARSEAVARQEEIIERMGQILKQMSQWDSFVDVLNQLNEVIRVQSQVQQGTNQLKRKQSEGVFDK